MVLTFHVTKVQQDLPGYFLYNDHRDCEGAGHLQVDLAVVTRQ